MTYYVFFTDNPKDYGATLIAYKEATAILDWMVEIG